MPPKQLASIVLRDQPGWITFGIDGSYAYPSTGDVIDADSRAMVATLTDETGRAVQSEKMLEIGSRAVAPWPRGISSGLGEAAVTG